GRRGGVVSRLPVDRDRTAPAQQRGSRSTIRGVGLAGARRFEVDLLESIEFVLERPDPALLVAGLGLEALDDLSERVDDGLLDFESGFEPGDLFVEPIDLVTALVELRLAAGGDRVEALDLSEQREDSLRAVPVRGPGVEHDEAFE